MFNLRALPFSVSPSVRPSVHLSLRLSITTLSNLALFWFPLSTLPRPPPRPTFSLSRPTLSLDSFPHLPMNLLSLPRSSPVGSKHKTSSSPPLTFLNSLHLTRCGSATALELMTKCGSYLIPEVDQKLCIHCGSKSNPSRYHHPPLPSHRHPPPSII